MATNHDLEIGRRAIAQNWIQLDQLKVCLNLQRQWQEKGKYFSLDKWLLKKNYLSHSQIQLLIESIPTIDSENPFHSDSQRDFLFPGEMFLHYQIQKKLGQGGMGVVYRAFDIKLKRVIALKLITGGNVNEQARHRFLREASAIAQLDHIGITKLYEVGDTPENYFTMEFVPGSNLHFLIGQPDMTPVRAARIIQKVATALSVVHNKNIIHRDIKPSNIMITEEDEPKLMDFGLAKITDIDSSLSCAGDILGTPHYMSPEQAEGRKIDIRTDVYSLGASLYEMLTNCPPFQGESYFNISMQVINDEPVLPTILNPDIPKDLEAICLKCMEKSPTKRYANARELAKDLECFLSHLPISARKLTRWELGKKFVIRHKVFCATLVAVTVLFMSAIFGYILLTEKHKHKLFIEKENSIEAAKITFQALYNTYLKKPELRTSRLEQGLKQIFLELKKFDLFIEMVASDVEILWLYGLVYGTTPEEFADGIEIYDKVIVRDPKHAIAYYGRALLHYFHKNYHKAKIDINIALKINPRLVKGYFCQGSIYRELKNFAKAEESFGLHIKHHSKDANAYIERGYIHFKQEQYTAAEQDFHRAIELNSHFARAYSLLGQLYEKQKNYTQALSKYNKAISLKTKSSMGYWYRGEYYRRQNKFKKALKDYNIAIVLNPKYTKAYYSLGEMQLVQGEYAKAQASFKQAIDISPGDAKLYHKRGEVFHKQGEITKAVVDWQKAIALGSPHKKELAELIKKQKK